MTSTARLPEALLSHASEDKDRFVLALALSCDRHSRSAQMGQAGKESPQQGIASDVRKGQSPGQLDRATFGARYRARFADPAFAAEADAIERLEAIAWDAYREGRKAPRTVVAGPGHADPSYELSEEWVEARARIRAAAALQALPDGPSRVLLIGGSPRNDGTCPGEISKTFRRCRSFGRRSKPPASTATCSTSVWSRQSTDATSIPARAACQPRCRCATGHAAAIRTTRWRRPATG